MKRISVALGCLYGVAAVIDICLAANGNETLRFVSKPLLMVLLMLMYVSELGITTSFSRLLLGALLFSWFGDILLLFNHFFVAGLIAFLAAHICYGIYILRIKTGTKGLLQFQPLFGIPVIAYWMLFLWLILSFLDALKIPVIIYSCVICTIWLLALNLFWKTDKKTAALFFFGAGQFVLSDSVLAINRFVYPFDILPAIVMMTYCSAQFLLVTGSIRHMRLLK